MSNTNSIIPFLGAGLQDLQDTIGITQFPSGTNWYQTIGGLLIQGGFLTVSSSAVTTVPFNAGYPTQVLGVWIQSVGGSHNNAHIDNVTLAQFELHNGGSTRDYYWWAIGV